VKTLRGLNDLRLLRTDKIKNPPRYEDLAASEALAAVPSGWRVLTVLLCGLAAIGLTLLAFRHFQHF
jgi:hypothetical protein